MTTQPEAILEDNLIQQLTTLSYSYASIHDEESLLANLKIQLDVFNQTTISDKEFRTILKHLSKGNIFTKAKTQQFKKGLLQQMFV